MEIVFRGSEQQQITNCCDSREFVSCCLYDVGGERHSSQLKNSPPSPDSRSAGAKLHLASMTAVE
jgi:hypothetical protein